MLRRPLAQQPVSICFPPCGWRKLCSTLSLAPGCSSQIPLSAFWGWELELTLNPWGKVCWDPGYLVYCTVLYLVIRLRAVLGEVDPRVWLKWWSEELLIWPMVAVPPMLLLRPPPPPRLLSPKPPPPIPASLPTRPLLTVPLPPMIPAGPLNPVTPEPDTTLSVTITLWALDRSGCTLRPPIMPEVGRITLSVTTTLEDSLGSGMVRVVGRLEPGAIILSVTMTLDPSLRSGISSIPCKSAPEMGPTTLSVTTTLEACRLSWMWTEGFRVPEVA